MKKIIYAILICIIIAGIVVIATVGLNADIIYSKNVELDVSISTGFERDEIESIVNEVFPGEKAIIQEIEFFGDMVSITVADRNEDELNSKIEELNTKINEKYGIENEVDDILVTHNAKVKLSSLLMPYLLTIGISIVIILIYAGIRYKKLGVMKTLISYIISIVGIEMLYLSIIAITRIPVNRTIIPIGLILLVLVVTVLGIKNENKLSKTIIEENKKSKKQTAK